jgi:hypothetical protein
MYVSPIKEPNFFAPEVAAVTHGAGRIILAAGATARQPCSVQSADIPRRQPGFHIRSDRPSNVTDARSDAAGRGLVDRLIRRALGRGNLAPPAPQDRRQVIDIYANEIRDLESLIQPDLRWLDPRRAASDS